VISATGSPQGYSRSRARLRDARQSIDGRTIVDRAPGAGEPADGVHVTQGQAAELLFVDRLRGALSADCRLFADVAWLGRTAD
jgi:hypothetical protein